MYNRNKIAVIITNDYIKEDSKIKDKEEEKNDRLNSFDLII